MGKNSSIEWCHHTVNFWWGCTFARLADGSLREECRNCYALLLSKLFSRGKATWGELGRRMIRHENARRELYKMDKAAHKRGVRERVFINSMSDTFEDRRDLDEAREMLWGACQFVSNLDLLLLTKRPENVMRMVPEAWLKEWPAHVWIGTTAGTQPLASKPFENVMPDGSVQTAMLDLLE
jgi:protein gp37